MITKAGEKDAEKIMRIISSEFPYKKFSGQTIAERLKNPGIIILKKIFNKQLAGFIDVEIKEDGGLINAVSVMQGYRRKGFGRELIEHALGMLRQNNVGTARLLVKRENEKAKRLYASLGFTLTGIHEKKIENSIIEIWSKELFVEDTGYLN